MRFENDETRQFRWELYYIEAVYLWGLLPAFKSGIILMREFSVNASRFLPAKLKRNKRRTFIRYNIEFGSIFQRSSQKCPPSFPAITYLFINENFIFKAVRNFKLMQLQKHRTRRELNQRNVWNLLY